MNRTAVSAAFCLLLLSGCTAKGTDCQSLLDASVQAALSAECDTPNYTKKYFAYYLPPDVGRYSANQTGSVFCWHGATFVMNLNVEKIVNDRYYPDSSGREFLLSDVSPEYTASGTYSDFSGAEHAYDVRIYRLSGSYVCAVDTDYVDFTAVTDQLSAVTLPKKMLRIARSIRIDTDEVASDFLIRSNIRHEQRSEQLFENPAPENGTIDELLLDRSDAASEDDASPSETPAPADGQ